MCLRVLSKFVYTTSFRVRNISYLYTPTLRSKERKGEKKSKKFNKRGKSKTRDWRRFSPSLLRKENEVEYRTRKKNKREK